ncbi:MAG: hypothetical protein U0175_20650 [Caldilineaceae bacterium]
MMLQARNKGQGRVGGNVGGLLLATSLYLLTGCTPIQPVKSSTPAENTTQPTLLPDSTKVITEENTMGTTLPSNPLVVQAMKDLAKLTGLSLDQITLVSNEAVTWPDGALGCPQPGMVYMQVLVDGSRIVLSAGGKSYEYHSGDQRGAFLCTNPQ